MNIQKGIAMLTTNFIPGVPVWIDLGTPNVEVASAFYGSLFGWTLQSAGPQGGGYGMFTLGDRTIAAVGPLTEHNQTAAWTLFLHTTDADATADAVEKAGGTVRIPPMDVFTQGRMAAFTDPTGAQFAVWQPRENKGLGAVMTAGSLCWTELYTSDPTAAKTFYASVFGWQTDDMPMNDFTYAVIRPSGGDQATTQGGIMAMNDYMVKAGIVSRWQPYFAVADCDAAAETTRKQSGSVLMPPETMEGIGRIALLVDPFAALFAVIAPTAS